MPSETRSRAALPATAAGTNVHAYTLGDWTLLALVALAWGSSFPPAGLLGMPGSTWAWDSALAMIPLGVYGTGIAFVLMAMLAGRVGGSRASIAVYFVPLWQSSLASSSSANPSPRSPWVAWGWSSSGRGSRHAARRRSIAGRARRTQARMGLAGAATEWSTPRIGPLDPLVS